MRNISISLGKDLTAKLQGHPILKDMNRSALVRSALNDYLERVLKEDKEENQNEKSEK